MQADLDCKPHETMKKNIIIRGLQSNKYGNNRFSTLL